MSDTKCPHDSNYLGQPPSNRQLAEIFTASYRRGRAINDPEVRREMSFGSGGARPGTDEHPCLMWQVWATGIEYQVGHDGVKRLLKWSTIEKMDDAQLDLLEELGS